MVTKKKEIAARGYLLKEKSKNSINGGVSKSWFLKHLNQYIPV